jgi:amino acid adenylation domain-containing protein
MIAGLLGILKAGAGYVPLDPGLPLQRRDFILSDSGVTVVLADETLSEGLPEGVRCLSIEACADQNPAEDDSNPDVDTVADNLAYVMYTSGSTGQPKGVLIPHRGVVRLVKHTNYADLSGGGHVFMQLAPLSFDASTFEIWAPLLNGGRLAIMPADSQTLDEIGRELVTQRVTTLWLTSALFDEMVDQQVESLRTIRQLLAGGDVLSQRHVDRYLRSSDGGILINGYGPTENTTFTCAFRAEPGTRIESSVPIGRAVANTDVHIVDGHLNLQPIGAPGELVTGKDGLARGYLNRPELTAEKFIPDPFGGQPGARLYRTGDLAVRRPDFNIEFIGRRDQQVKIRGFRIELQEIEEALKSQPGIRQAVAIVRDESAGKRLVAYLVWNGVQRVPAAALKARLASMLPDYMIPNAFVALESIPITQNGKVDRRALPDPGLVRLEQEDPSLPRDATELRLAQIWQQVLSLPAVGIDDNFFDSGGHSLLAARLMAKVEREFKIALPLSVLFAHPSVSALASRLRMNQRDEPYSRVVPVQPHGALRPFFCVHPAGGNVFCYGHLARYLGSDRPFFALQAQGLSPGEACHGTIEQMAADYIEAVLEVQNEGPYLLGGWSMGGVVAFEMSRQLEQRGQRVDALVLIDSRNPRLDADLLANRSSLESFAFHLGLPGDRLGGAPLSALNDPLAFILEQAISANLLPAGIDLERLRRLYDVFNSNVEALKRYVPHPTSTAITLLRANRQRRTAIWSAKSGWNGLADGVRIYEVPGNHFTMMRPPHVQELAERLAACLDSDPALPGSSHLTLEEYRNQVQPDALMAGN